MAYTQCRVSDAQLCRSACVDCRRECLRDPAKGGMENKKKPVLPSLVRIGDSTGEEPVACTRFVSRVSTGSTLVLPDVAIANGLACCGHVHRRCAGAPATFAGWASCE